jgi:hypothetical protein
MHILERRDAILADAVVGIVEEKTHRRVLRCLACTPPRKAGKYLDCVYQRAGLMRTSRIASQRDLKVRKAVIALRKQVSTGSEENLRREPGWQSARRDIGVGQPTELLQRFSAIASVAVCSVLRDRTSGRLFEAHKAKSRLSRIFWHARPRGKIQHCIV